MQEPIMMTEDYWRNSQLSVARFYGGIEFCKKNYRIVNKYGRSLFELSDPESPYFVGHDAMAIEPGEPADLVQVDWIPVYKILGREKFIRMIQDNPKITLKKAREIARLK